MHCKCQRTEFELRFEREFRLNPALPFSSYKLRVLLSKPKGFVFCGIFSCHAWLGQLVCLGNFLQFYLSPSKTAMIVSPWASRYSQCVQKMQLRALIARVREYHFRITDPDECTSKNNGMMRPIYDLPAWFVEVEGVGEVKISVFARRLWNNHLLPIQKLMAIFTSV